MARWLASDVPEWLSGLLFLAGLPALMLLVQALVRRILPQWERGRHNDAAGVMLSAAVVVYSIAIGLCVVTLWERLDDAHRATEAEATNLAAVAQGSRVFDVATQERIRAGVIAYNKDVIDGWALRTHGEAVPKVSDNLDALVASIGTLQPQTPAQRAFLDDATARLDRAAELRAVSVRLAKDQQLPDIMWVAVVGGSVIVLGLCLTCGVRDGVLRRVLLVGVTATVGINLFLVVELNYPFYGSVSIQPDAYANVVAALDGR